MSKNELWIFDVCGTLYDSNTTFDFLHYYFKKHSLEKLRRLKTITNKKTPVYIFRAFAFKVLKKDFFRKQALLLLKGEHSQLIESEANNFYGDFLMQKELKQVHDIFDAKMKSSQNCILVSNSISPVIKAIADNQKVNYKATRLEERNGIYTGKITDDLFGRKHQVLDDLNFDTLAVVTDNRSDYDLVKRGDVRYVVVNSKSGKMFWEKLKPKFIEV